MAVGFETQLRVHALVLCTSTTHAYATHGIYFYFDLPNLWLFMMAARGLSSAGSQCPFASLYHRCPVCFADRISRSHIS
jgi:hypothetical protein